jgi:alkylation response protein AidB-like acyl-CoA dehydrogenase
MTTVDSSLSAAVVLDDARRIAGGLGDRSREIEAARRVPPDLLQALIAAGCFRILLPTTHGGAGATLPEALELYETIATGDASTGWTVMIGATGWCDLARLPRATFDALFPPSADVIVAGAFAPSGSIAPIDSGYELTGRWGFVSGCEHATYLFLNAVEGVADGHPLMRASVLDPADVTIEDTWTVAGLRGTGSHHISVRDVAVPPERTFVPLVDPPCVEVPIVHISTPAIFALGIAAVAIGAAQGALDEVVGLAQGKVPLLAPGPLATSPLFHHDLARADAGLAAGRALLAEATGRLWERAAAGADVALEDRARARAAAAWAMDAALVATEFAYRAAGGGALYAESPLQRRLRDVHAMTQHFLVRPDTFVTAGGILAGQGLTIPVF